MNQLLIFAAALTTCCLAVPQQGRDPHVVQILRQSSDLNPDGSYQWSYETENGIAAQEQGQLKNAQSQEPAMEAQGSFQYTAPDGTPIAVQYVANENGFQPQGAHLPPVPEYIARALAWNAAHPEEEREQPQRRF